MAYKFLQLSPSQKFESMISRLPLIASSPALCTSFQEVTDPDPEQKPPLWEHCWKSDKDLKVSLLRRLHRSVH